MAPIGVRGRPALGWTDQQLQVQELFLELNDEEIFNFPTTIAASSFQKQAINYWLLLLDLVLAA